MNFFGSPILLFTGAVCIILLVIGAVFQSLFYVLPNKEHEKVERARIIWLGGTGVVPLVAIVAVVGILSFSIMRLRNSSNYWFMLLRQKLQELVNMFLPGSDDGVGLIPWSDDGDGLIGGQIASAA